MWEKIKCRAQSPPVLIVLEVNKSGLEQGAISVLYNNEKRGCRPLVKG